MTDDTPMMGDSLHEFVRNEVDQIINYAEFPYNIFSGSKDIVTPDLVEQYRTKTKEIVYDAAINAFVMLGMDYNVSVMNPMFPMFVDFAILFALRGFGIGYKIAQKDENILNWDTLQEVMQSITDDLNFAETAHDMMYGNNVDGTEGFSAIIVNADDPNWNDEIINDEQIIDYFLFDDPNWNDEVTDDDFIEEELESEDGNDQENLS